jgi:23S rRNA pseudouridine1911/1915/1917 synthase
VNLPPKRHFLHAAWLIFKHPVSGREIEVRSPLPDDLRAALIHIADGSIPGDGDLLEHLGFYSAR